MGKRVAHEACGKSHQSFEAKMKCEAKHKKATCTCPNYWKERGWNHSFTHGCPLAG